MSKRKLNTKWLGMRPLKEAGDYAAVNLVNHLKKQFPVTGTFDEGIKPMLHAYIAIRRVQFAVPGDLLKTALWIDSGYVRLHRKFTNTAGVEILETIDFGIRQSILVIPECFFNGKKCTCYIEIMKGTVVIPFTRELFDMLKLLAPETTELTISVLSSRNPIQMKKASFVRLDGVARYDLFMEMYGKEINDYFSQKEIASFLGMSTTHLSNLRAARNRRKIDDVENR
jgi:hypothetical protein